MPTETRDTPSPGIQVTCIIFIALVSCAIGLRLYTRACITMRFGLDDVFAVIGTACAVATFTVATVGAENYGLNRHTWDISPATYKQGQKSIFIYDVMFSQAACQTKLSLLWFTRRLIGTATSSSPFQAHYVILIALMCIVAICQIFFIVISCLECRYDLLIALTAYPLKAVWDPHPDYPYTCLNVAAFLLAGGLINTSTDLCCTILPALIVMKLQMPFRRKVAVASVFLLGISVNIASVLRIYYVIIVYRIDDNIYALPSIIAGSFELGLGLICVNIPSLRPLFARYANYLKSYSRSRGSGNADSTYVSASRSRQTRRSHNLAASSELANSQGQTFSTAGRADGQMLKGGGDIEVTRTVELDTLRQTSSHSKSVDGGRNVEWTSQEDLVRNVI